jgi:S-adenosylmethionine:tRNA ribosyltransferase-isomerase
MKTSDFNYTLPPSLIAQDPLAQREQARLMIVNSGTQTLQDKQVEDLTELLTDNDVLVFNETKVFPARLHGNINEKPVEILLHRELTPNQWECLTKPGKRFKMEAIINFGTFSAKVVTINPDGSRILEFSESKTRLQTLIDTHGETPLPPYIQESHSKPEQYQTVYAKSRGSVAAPTAGLHFTPELLKKLKEKGVEQHFVTLHVGRGTFEPVKADLISEHTMHNEWLELTEETAAALNNAKKSGKRIIAVGTTTVRTLESCSKNGTLTAQKRDTDLFITPGYEFQFVDGMITNFHLPKSTLLMLISALAGKDLIFQAYEDAITKKYRFYSFGDAMLIL